MGEHTSPKANIDGSWPRPNDLVLFRLGYLQRTCDLILAEVRARPSSPPSASIPSGPGTWGRICGRTRDWVVETLHRLWQLWRRLREWPWGVLGWALYGGLRWLGVF
jgi:hypothetical protein